MAIYRSRRIRVGVRRSMPPKGSSLAKRVKWYKKRLRQHPSTPISSSMRRLTKKW